MGPFLKFLSRGSSPRMRGAPAGHQLPRLLARIIPADAGSTGSLFSCPQDSPDHPRGCEEHRMPMHSQKPRCGSSPRMRGALRGLEVELCEGGIIPADAGSTAQAHEAAPREGDHPRGCGEHCSGRVMRLCKPGSSPRMRGAHRADLAPRILHGIIPADAGSTQETTEVSSRRTDHPRGCGEHEVVWQCHFCSLGSSPRMRGALCY